MRFWLGAQSKKGGRGHRSREEIGGGGSNEIFISLEASPLVREGFARDFMASPLSSAPDKTAMLRRLLILPSIYMGKPEISVGKLNGQRHLLESFRKYGL